MCKPLSISPDEMETTYTKILGVDLDPVSTCYLAVKVSFQSVANLAAEGCSGVCGLRLFKSWLKPAVWGGQFYKTFCYSK